MQLNQDSIINSVDSASNAVSTTPPYESKTIFKIVKSKHVPVAKSISYTKLIKILAAFHSKRANFTNDYNSIVNILHFKSTALGNIQLEHMLIKCKEKFYKALNDVIKHLIGKQEDKRIRRIPYELIINENHGINQKMLNMRITDIYIQYEIDVSFLHKGIKTFTIKDDGFININEESKEYLLQLLDLSFVECYNNYLKSRRYKEDYDNYQKTFGEKYAILFDYVAKILISYYNLNKQQVSEMSNNDNDKNKTITQDNVGVLLYQKD